MRTITQNVYTFSELDDDAKDRARSWCRDQCMDYTFGDLWYEATQSRDLFLREFNAEFNHGRYNSESVVIPDSYNDYGYRIHNNRIGELSYIRLYKYLVNNHSDCISKIGDCQFTGMCYDEYLLDDIAEFIRKPYRTDFESLLYSCCENLRIAVEAEIEYQNSDEAIDEAITCNEYEFTLEGDRA
jgi:hypothetical protein